jgi:hypothetical protein
VSLGHAFRGRKFSTRRTFYLSMCVLTMGAVVLTRPWELVLEPESCIQGCSFDFSAAERRAPTRSCQDTTLLDPARLIDPSQCAAWGDALMPSIGNGTLGVVPCILHYQGRDDAKSHEFVDSWRRCMPPEAPCRTMFWTDDLLNQLVATKYPQFWEIYSAAPIDVLRWDMSRYMVLHAHGGIYFDNDYECRAPPGKFVLGSGATRCE